MSKYYRFLAIAGLTLYPWLSLAGTPMTTIDCKSADNQTQFSGTPGGEYFDLKIKINNSEIRYTNYCDDVECNKNLNYGNITVVDALYDKVFTISFANNENNNRGIFYALPDTVKYEKTKRGYSATYKGIYLGDDPRSNEPFKASVPYPGISLFCKQKNEL